MEAYLPPRQVSVDYKRLELHRDAGLPRRWDHKLLPLHSADTLGLVQDLVRNALVDKVVAHACELVLILEHR